MSTSSFTVAAMDPYSELMPEADDFANKLQASDMQYHAPELMDCGQAVTVDGFQLRDRPPEEQEPLEAPNAMAAADNPMHGDEAGAAVDENLHHGQPPSEPTQLPPGQTQPENGNQGIGSNDDSLFSALENAANEIAANGLPDAVALPDSTVSLSNGIDSAESDFTGALTNGTDFFGCNQSVTAMVSLVDNSNEMDLDDERPPVMTIVNQKLTNGLPNGDSGIGVDSSLHDDYQLNNGESDEEEEEAMQELTRKELEAYFNKVANGRKHRRKGKTNVADFVIEDLLSTMDYKDRTMERKVEERDSKRQSKKELMNLIGQSQGILGSRRKRTSTFASLFDNKKSPAVKKEVKQSKKPKVQIKPEPASETEEEVDDGFVWTKPETDQNIVKNVIESIVTQVSEKARFYLRTVEIVRRFIVIEYYDGDTLISKSEVAEHDDGKAILKEATFDEQNNADKYQVDAYSEHTFRSNNFSTIIADDYGHFHVPRSMQPKVKLVRSVLRPSRRVYNRSPAKKQPPPKRKRSNAGRPKRQVDPVSSDDEEETDGDSQEDSEESSQDDSSEEEKPKKKTPPKKQAPPKKFSKKKPVPPTKKSAPSTNKSVPGRRRVIAVKKKGSSLPKRLVSKIVARSSLKRKHSDMMASKTRGDELGRMNKRIKLEFPVVPIKEEREKRQSIVKPKPQATSTPAKSKSTPTQSTIRASRSTTTPASGRSTPASAKSTPAAKTTPIPARASRSSPVSSQSAGRTSRSGVSVDIHADPPDTRKKVMAVKSKPGPASKMVVTPIKSEPNELDRYPKITVKYAKSTMESEIVEGARVFGKWPDGSFYPGVLNEELVQDKWHVQFDDGTFRVLSVSDILKIKLLSLDQPVCAAPPGEDYYENGVIKGHFKGNKNEVGYIIQMHTGETTRFTQAQVILSREDGLLLLQKQNGTAKAIPNYDTIDVPNYAVNARRVANAKPLPPPPVSRYGAAPHYDIPPTNFYAKKSTPYYVSNSPDDLVERIDSYGQLKEPDRKRYGSPKSSKRKRSYSSDEDEGYRRGRRGYSPSDRRRKRYDSDSDRDDYRSGSKKRKYDSKRKYRDDSSDDDRRRPGPKSKGSKRYDSDSDDGYRKDSRRSGRRPSPETNRSAKKNYKGYSPVPSDDDEPLVKEVTPVKTKPGPKSRGKKEPSPVSEEEVKPKIGPKSRRTITAPKRFKDASPEPEPPKKPEPPKARATRNRSPAQQVVEPEPLAPRRGRAAPAAAARAASVENEKIASAHVVLDTMNSVPTAAARKAYKQEVIEPYPVSIVRAGTRARGAAIPVPVPIIVPEPVVTGPRSRRGAVAAAVVEPVVESSPPARGRPASRVVVKKEVTIPEMDNTVTSTDRNIENATEDHGNSMAAQLGPMPGKNSTLFKGMAFLLTAATRKPEKGNDDYGKVPFNKSYLKSQIKNGKGQVLDNFDANQLTAAKQCFLLSEAHTRTVKYIQCLAAGIPCVSHRWIKESCEKNRLLNYHTYLLPAGYSLESERVIEWHGKRDILNGMDILLLSVKNKTFSDIWSPVVLAANANVVRNRQLVGVICPTDFLSGVDVVVTDVSCPKSVLNRAKEFRVPVVSSEWLIQCLIHGRKLHFEGHEKYAYDCALD